MANRSRWRFGPFEVDALEHQLRRNGTLVAVTRKSLSLLITLLDRPGSLFTKDELFKTVWAGSVVSDAALSRVIRELRVALDDDTAAPRYIATVHGIGFRFVATVEGETTWIAATQGVRSASPTERAVQPTDADLYQQPLNGALFGRDGECARATTEIQRALQQRHGLLLEICGEPGIGKSRVAQALLEQARRLGASVVQSGAADSQGAPPFWLWVQVLRQLAARGRAQSWPGVVALPDEQRTLGAVTDILRLLPQLDELEPHGAEQLRLRAESTRFRIRDAVVRQLCELARAEPLVLLLDDLHLARQDCLDVLVGVMHSIRELPIVLLTIYRDVGAAPNPALAAALLEFARSNLSRLRIALRGLDLDAVTELLTHGTNESIAAHARDSAMAKTGGNPLFLNELLALSISALPNHDAALAVWELDRPESVQQLMLRRLVALSPNGRAVLAAAAVCGAKFTTRVLQQSRLFLEAAVDAALKESLTQRLLEHAPGGAGTWRFTHDLLREVAYDTLDTSDREQLHLRFAETLQRINLGHNESLAAELAQHYARAPSSPEQAAALLHHLALAARQAFERFAFAEAAQLYATLRDRLLLAESRDHRALCLAILGSALSFASCGAPESARAEAANALVQARRANDALLLSDAVILSCSLESAYPPKPELIELIDEALLRFDADGELVARSSANNEVDRSSHIAARAGLLAQRGFQHYILGNVDALQADAAAALAAARAANQRAALEQALSTCCLAFANPAQELQWRDAYDERIALARTQHDAWAEFDARRHRLEHLLQIGPRAEVDAEVARLQRVATRVDTPSMRASMLRIHTGLAIADGRIAEAWPLAQRALGQGLESTDPGTAQAFALLQIGALVGYRGDYAHVAEQVENDDIVAHNSLLMAARVLVLCLTKRWDAAQQRMRELAMNDFARLPRDMTYGMALGSLARSCMLLRDTDTAQLLLRLLQPYAGRNITALCYYSTGSAARELGLLEATLGNIDAACEYFEVALRSSADMGHYLWRLDTAHSYLQIVERRARRGRPRLRELALEVRTLSERTGVSTSALVSPSMRMR